MSESLMKVQITLTVPGGKRLIARAVASLPQLGQALINGRILLIGGTTVSAISEELGYGPMWIAGRIEPGGTRTAGSDKHTAPHTLLIIQGHPKAADVGIEEIAASFGHGDLIITGANALLTTGEAVEGTDFFPGVAALALAAEKGGSRGEALRLAGERGVSIIVACGLEKFIPGSLVSAIGAAGRAETDLAMGAAIDLLPISGQVITELEALRILFGVKATTIAGGGILGGEGSRVFALAGSVKNIHQAMDYVRTLVGATTSAAAPSLATCSPPCYHCGRHISCIYLKEVTE